MNLLSTMGGLEPPIQHVCANVPKRVLFQLDGRIRPDHGEVRFDKITGGANLFQRFATAAMPALSAILEAT
ncbi:MAG: hypothetical protein KGL56_01770 [Alphaproteobacteria bacterium]|nr:hypothetical protein [Alphaproteobacteria bacterium]MDE2162309.1 hypothetical protein [Alphaproteobacteria bacterium]MDE2498893.1 hypothetical protein [Alphaproteobacteria bacterium]